MKTKTPKKKEKHDDGFIHVLMEVHNERRGMPEMPSTHEYGQFPK